jgi:hypothetical protein
MRNDKKFAFNPKRLDDPVPRPSQSQRRYAQRGLSQPLGKLPLFGADRGEVAPRTVQACVPTAGPNPGFNGLTIRSSPIG